MLWAAISVGLVAGMLGIATAIDARAVRDLLFVSPSGVHLRWSAWAAAVAMWLGLTLALRQGVAAHAIVLTIEGSIASIAMLYLVWQYGTSAFHHACWQLSGEHSSAAAKLASSGAAGRLECLKRAATLVVGTVAIIPATYLAAAGFSVAAPIVKTLTQDIHGVYAATSSASLATGLAVIVVVLAWLRERATTRELARKVEALQGNDVVAAERDRMRLSAYPDSFPTGWYRVCDSDELKKGSMMTVRMLGLEVVAFRGSENGVASVLGAFCPHLGAHIGVGGRVVGDCVECPFHRWQFDCDGRVAHVPYCDAPPTGAHAHATRYHTREYYGWVMMWYDAEDAGSVVCAPPAYEPPRVPDVDDGTLVFRGSTSPPDVRMHLQEFAENSADPQHFQPLHDRAYFPYTDVPIPFMEVMNSTQWHGPSAKMSSSEGVSLGIVDEVREDGKRHIAFTGPMIAEFKDTIAVRIFGRDMPHMSAKADITFVGPGGLSFFRFDIPQVGRVHMFQAMTPRGLMAQHVDFRYYAPASVPQVLVSYVVGNWIQNFKADVSVWENKIFLQRPLLVKGDGPFMRMRAWVAQFYAKSKPKRSIVLETSEKETSSSTDAAPVPAASETLREVTRAELTW